MPFLEDSNSHLDRRVRLADDGKASFEDLVQKLRDALGPTSGLDSADVDPAHIQSIMKGYQSIPTQWQRYALADPSRAYTRNLVDEGNDKSNLLIIVWSPGRESAVHDHANAHCVMKILKGSLKETLYAMPANSKLISEETKPLEMTRETTFGVDDVAYISDKIGLHKISNPSPDDFAVSLHLYTPPHAARYGFNLFDERTGKASHIGQAKYFSCDGQRI